MGSGARRRTRGAAVAGAVAGPLEHAEHVRARGGGGHGLRRRLLLQGGELALAGLDGALPVLGGLEGALVDGLRASAEPFDLSPELVELRDRARLRRHAALREELVVLLAELAEELRTVAAVAEAGAVDRRGGAAERPDPVLEVEGFRRRLLHELLVRRRLGDALVEVADVARQQAKRPRHLLLVHAVALVEGGHGGGDELEPVVGHHGSEELRETLEIREVSPQLGERDEELGLFRRALRGDEADAEPVEVARRRDGAVVEGEVPVGRGGRRDERVAAELGAHVADHHSEGRDDHSRLDVPAVEAGAHGADHAAVLLGEGTVAEGEDAVDHAQVGHHDHRFRCAPAERHLTSRGQRLCRLQRRLEGVVQGGEGRIVEDLVLLRHTVTRPPALRRRVLLYGKGQMMFFRRCHHDRASEAPRLGFPKRRAFQEPKGGAGGVRSEAQSARAGPAEAVWMFVGVGRSILAREPHEALIDHAFTSEDVSTGAEHTVPRKLGLSVTNRAL